MSVWSKRAKCIAGCGAEAGEPCCNDEDEPQRVACAGRAFIRPEPQFVPCAACARLLPKVGVRNIPGRKAYCDARCCGVYAGRVNAAIHARRTA